MLCHLGLYDEDEMQQLLFNMILIEYRKRDWLKKEISFIAQTDNENSVRLCNVHHLENIIVNQNIVSM